MAVPQTSESTRMSTVAVGLSAIILLEIAAGISLNAVYWKRSRSDVYEFVLRRDENREAYWANVIYQAVVVAIVWIMVLIRPDR